MIRNALVPALCVIAMCAASCADDDMDTRDDGDDNPVSSAANDNDNTSDDARLAGTVVISASGSFDPGPWGTDDYQLDAVAMAGDTLVATLSYGGGCETHRFTLVAASAFLESDPVQLDVAIAHDANDDPCEAWLTKEYGFVLTPIKARYHASYGTGAGTIVLRLNDAPDGRVVYEFAN